MSDLEVRDLERTDPRRARRMRIRAGLEKEVRVGDLVLFGTSAWIGTEWCRGGCVGHVYAIRAQEEIDVGLELEIFLNFHKFLARCREHNNDGTVFADRSVTIVGMEEA